MSSIKHNPLTPAIRVASRLIGSAMAVLSSKPTRREPVEVYLDFRGVISPVDLTSDRGSIRNAASRQRLSGTIPASEFEYDCRDGNMSWSSELARRLVALTDDGSIRLTWLTSDWPFVPTINKLLKLRHTRKEDYVDKNSKYTTIKRAIRQCARRRPQCRLVWIDDDYGADDDLWRIGLSDLVAKHGIAMLKITPNGAIGISRRQWEVVEEFVASPLVEPGLRFLPGSSDV